MELWQLNIVVVLVIMLLTRKDMALLVGGVMSLGYLATLGDYSQFELSLIFCALNAGLALVAAGYSYFKFCNLSIVTACLASVATMINLMQAYDQTMISSTITSILGWSLAAALLLMDGDKGIINGFMGDFRATSRRLLISLSHNNNNKGAN